MVELDTKQQILAEAYRIAMGQAGGTLATVHADDATPYVTFVLFHLRESGELLFGSGTSQQQSLNIEATPEVSFLVDNREVIATNWMEFDRVVIEGSAELIPNEDPRYAAYLSELDAKSELAGRFTRAGNLYCIRPRRLLLAKGSQPGRHFVEFE